MKIIPSLVEQSAPALFDRIAFLSPYFRQFQIDIEDGIFVKNKTLRVEEFVSFVLSNPPTHSPFVYDFHLMVCDPENHLPIIAKLPRQMVGTIFIHFPVFPPYQLLTTTYPTYQFGLVLNPEDKVQDIPPTLISSLPALQLMTIHPGPQGQPFIKEVLIKIEQLRNRGFGGKIYIDGAVNETTFPLFSSLRFQPDFLCPGSYLAKSPKEDLARRVRYLMS